MLLPLAGRRIWYDLAGPDHGPVMCITHSLASDSGMWGEQMAPLLQAGFRVLRIDMRGHGGTDPVAGDYTMDQLADDTATVLEALGLSGVHYMGLSMGGMHGLGLALRHGRLLKSMILADASCASPSGRDIWDPRVATVRKAKSLEPIADGTLERWFTPAMKTANPRRLKQIRDTIVATSVDGFAGCIAALTNFDYSARLPSIKVPTLVVWGAEDPGTPPEGNRRIVSLIPGARGEEIPKIRHFSNVEAPDAYNRIMMGFLAAQK
jgi:3-oxoadipate enol-lactonase